MVQASGYPKRGRVYMAGKLLSDKVPEIFHYTSVEAFASIYRTRKVWATHFSDMNDSSEQLRFQNFAIQFAQPLLVDIFERRSAKDPAFARRLAEGGGNPVIADREARMHVSEMHQSIFGDFDGPFISSFCAHDANSFEASHGLLSQWRGYGSNGGVAMVFSTAGIEALMEHERTEFAHALNHIGEVRYDHELDVIRTDFGEYFEQLPGILENFYRAVRPPYELVFDAFIRGTTLVKHRAFHEEQEIRIVVCPRTRKQSSVFYEAQHEALSTKSTKYRQRLEGEARYVELFRGTSLPIKRVIIGPSRIQNVSYQRVFEILGGSGISIEVSSTPFAG